MTDEPDYKKMYDEIKTQYDAINTKITDMEKSISDRDKKITELQIYIADNVVSKKTTKEPINTSFDDVYKQTLKEMENKK